MLLLAGPDFSRQAALLLSIVLLTTYLSPLTAQTWNTAEALTLIHRAVDRRLAVQADSTLRSYRARAHGFVFFLAQVGAGLAEPPRLVKADELNVEVYWQAPDRSKQVVLGWRDGAFLPTDISYHRDHLGIVTNNFGNVIRIGEGDEVRDVVHPLSPAGLAAYDFALGDSLAIHTGKGEVTVYQVQVKPRSFGRPLVVGVLYIDVATAEMVRFRFSFTPASYLDRQLEDISVVLENALFENRYWLPHRQEVEIRRRARWLDFPARGIIRGRWKIGDYDLNLELPAQLFQGMAIGGLLQPRKSDSTWAEPLERAIAGVAEPLNQQDMETLRREIDRLAASRSLVGLPSKRLAVGSISDVARVNRVQGLALGLGGVAGFRRSGIQFRPSISYGTADDRLLGSIAAAWNRGSTGLKVVASRRMTDLSDVPVISPVLNSLTSQESGTDHGDYVLLHSLEAGVRERLSGRTALGMDLGVEVSRSVATEAAPANGSYRPNPALGTRAYRVARFSLERLSGGIGAQRDFEGLLSLEFAEGSRDYARAAARGRWLGRVGGSEIMARGYLGAGSDHLAPYRSFVLGGRGTLLGEPFRAYGGRTMALAHLEWRFEVPVPAVALGSFASTGRRMTLAPFVAAGVAGNPLPGLPWSSSDGIRPVAGLALEWFMRLIRIEAGVGLRDGGFGVTVDVNRDWWGLL